MAEATLLTIVQNILSAMSSDEVNSISDTTESMQVAQIVQNKYYDIVARGSLTIDETLYQLTASNNAATPVLMYMPTGATRLDWIKYYDTNVLDNQQNSQFQHGVNTDIISSTHWVTTSTTSNTIGTGTQTFTVASSTLPIVTGQGVVCVSGTNSMFGTVTSYSSTTLVLNVTSTVGSGTFSSWVIQNSNFNALPGYKYVDVISVEDFLALTNSYNPSESDVGSMTFTEGGYNFTFYYKTNLQPTYCTVLANYYVLFNSYDNTQDTTLQQVKTLCFGQTVPVFLLQDSFVPVLDDHQFPLLLNESKELAFYELKQQPHALANSEVKRQWAVAQKTKSKSNKPSYFNQLMDMGRVPRTGGYGGYPLYKWMRESY